MNVGCNLSITQAPASLRLCPTPIFQNSPPDLHRHNSVRADPYAHPQHINVLKHFVYI